MLTIYQARDMVSSGAFNALEATLDLLALRLTLEREFLVPNCASRVDFQLLIDDNPPENGVIVEIKAPHILDLCMNAFEGPYYHLTYNEPNTDRALIQQIMNKVSGKPHHLHGIY